MPAEWVTTKQFSPLLCAAWVRIVPVAVPGGSTATGARAAHAAPVQEVQDIEFQNSKFQAVEGILGLDLLGRSL